MGLMVSEEKIYLLKKFKKFHRLSKNYTFVFITVMFEALSLLVYLSNPHSGGYNSISILIFL